MAGLEPGAKLVVLATDPEASIDLAAWAADEGHAFVEHQLEGWAALTLEKHG